MDVHNAKNEYVGRIDQDGDIFDYNNNYLGKVEYMNKEKMSAISNRYGTFCGSLLKSSSSSEMTAYAPQGEFIATVDSDGEICRDFARQRNQQDLKPVGSVETDSNPYIYGAGAFFFANSQLFWTEGVPDIARVRN